MKTDQEKTKVIFRKFTNGGDIIALFPELAGTNDYQADCLSYQHIGQHGAADCPYITTVTLLAKPEEYKSLQAELKSIGYNLAIVKRFSRKDLEARKFQCH
jgi:hypothetical protein